MIFMNVSLRSSWPHQNNSSIKYIFWIWIWHGKSGLTRPRGSQGANLCSDKTTLKQLLYNKFISHAITLRVYSTLSLLFHVHTHPERGPCTCDPPIENTKQVLHLPAVPRLWKKRPSSATLRGPAATQSPGSLELNVPVILPGRSSGSWIQAITIKSGHS